MSNSNCSIHWCSVGHRRRFPIAYRFRYRIFSVFLDIDKLVEINSSCRLFACDRAAAVSFQQRDHGPCDGSSLRAWIDEILERNALPKPARVMLQCMPRVFGYVFNPISLWYCFDAAGQPIALLVEVNNTFGEKHCYLLENQQKKGAPMRWPVRQGKDKYFHVSPFIDMQARYEFTVADPREKMLLGIREYQDGELMLLATQTGERVDLSDRTLLRCIVMLPFSTLKVMFAIHWQAIKIWIRGGRYYRKPQQRAESVT